MAEQIITLGIGASSSLTPFILTGLDIATVTVSYSGETGAYIPFRDKRATAPARDKRAVVPFRDKRGLSGNN